MVGREGPFQTGVVGLAEEKRLKLWVKESDKNDRLGVVCMCVVLD